MQGVIWAHRDVELMKVIKYILANPLSMKIKSGTSLC